MAIGSALSVGLIGLKAFIVQIQAFVSPGLPYFSIIGLPDTSLSEARERSSRHARQVVSNGRKPVSRSISPQRPCRRKALRMICHRGQRAQRGRRNRP